MLDSHSIREIAGVPNTVRFIDGLPIDNNDKEYGNFTVYLSTQGDCYHSRAVCCSSRHPRHIMRVGDYYKPCSKCCPSGGIKIPQWATEYAELKAKAEKCGL